MFDLLIRGGTVIDGTGVPRRRADVGIAAGKIAAVGEIPEGSAALTIDAAGFVVAPGFIDLHAHSDLTLLANPRADSKIMQGVTTEIFGNCGWSAAPARGEGKEAIARAAGELGLSLSWESVADYLGALERQGVALNVGMLVGHGTLRAAAAGYADRPMDGAERELARRFLAEALEQGAFGMSSGLIYPPGCYADARELGELARLVASSGGFYATHLRSEGSLLREAIGEALEVGRTSGVPVHISHLKAAGAENWGRMEEILHLLEDAAARGQEVTWDQYPYTATSTGLAAMLPDWVHEGGPRQMLRRLRDPRLRGRIIRETDGMYARDDGWARTVIAHVKSARNRRFEGTSVADIAGQLGKEPAEAVIDLLVEEDGSVGMIRFILSEEDVRCALRHRGTAIASDASALVPRGVLGRGKPHPRSYGCFPRVLGRYVREEGVLGLEEAVRKMTSLPAARLGLRHRGIIKTGNWADVVVFDERTILDTSTFNCPHSYPRGVEFVLVNGTVVALRGRHTGRLPGAVLRGRQLA